MRGDWMNEAAESRMSPSSVTIYREGRARWQADARMPNGSTLNVSLGFGDAITAMSRAETVFPGCRNIEVRDAN